MRMSDQIDKLAEALAKAQGQMKPAVYDGTNPHFRAKYATLTAVMESCRPALSANGIALLQSTVVEGEPVARVGVSTMLVHTSGQWVLGTLHLKPVNDTPQAVGSALTYARRYSLAALVGIVAEEDDDAEKAHGRNGAPSSENPGNTEKPSRSPRRTTEPKPATDKQAVTAVTPQPPKADRVGKMREIFSLSARLHQSPDVMKGYIGELLGMDRPIKSSEEIPDDKIDSVLARFGEEVAKLGGAQEAKAA